MEKEVRDFGSAIKALKAGYKVAREGWNGKGMSLFIINNWQMVTNKAEDWNMGINGNNNLPFICMKTVDNKFVPWLASQTDMLAEDWTIVE